MPIECIKSIFPHHIGMVVIVSRHSISVREGEAFSLVVCHAQCVVQVVLVQGASKRASLLHTEVGLACFEQHISKEI